MDNTLTSEGPDAKLHVSDEEKTRSDSFPTICEPEEASINTEDVLGLQNVDPALNRKMRLVNDVGRLDVTETLNCMSLTNHDKGH